MPIRATLITYWKSKGRWKYGVLALVALLIATGVGFWLDTPGVRQCVTSVNLEQCYLLGKTFWDWLGLIGVPLSLAVLGYILQRQQQKRSEALAKEQREIAADAEKEEILQTYFDRLSTLLVDKNLLALAVKIHLHSTEVTLEQRELFNAAIDVIRARTLSILRRFKNDPERKGSVIQFLIEADIIDKAKINLSGADLRKADLSDADLSNANLSKVNFHGANLGNTKLSNADLNFSAFNAAFLFGAILDGASLFDADLSDACFNGALMHKAHLFAANLARANLMNVDLSSANLIRANLMNANLRGADLSDADLSDADLSDADLSGTGFFFGKTKLYGANLSGANLSGTDLDEIKWDEATAWPAAEEVAKAHNIPEVLKQQLGIE